MGILDRIDTLIRANVNDLMHRSDEPERALDHSIRDMKSSVTEARTQLRRSEQDEAKLHKQWRAAREETLEWEDKAMIALREGDEGLARELLMVKKKVERRAEALREELAQQRDYLADLTRSLDALQMKMEAVRGRRHSIGRHVSGDEPSAAESRERRAERQERPRGGFTLPSFDSDDAPPRRRPSREDVRREGQSREDSFSKGRRAFVFDDDLRREHPEEVFGAGDTFDTFDRMSDRIQNLEADVAASASLSDDPLHDHLSDRFRNLESERDLRDLRARASSPPPARESRPAPPSRPASPGKESLSELRRRLAEELDG